MQPTRRQAIPSLARWGLSPDADIVYRTLILYGARPSSALARELGINRLRVDRALSDLRDAKAADESTEPGCLERQWHATPEPILSAELIRRRHPSRGSSSGPRPRLLTTDFALLGPGLIHLPSREATRRRLAELVLVARHEELTMYPETSFEPGVMKAAIPMVQTLMDRGVHLRVLGLHSNPDLRFAEASPWGKPRSDYREASHVPMKLFVIDRKVAIFPVNPANFEQGFLEVSQRPVVQSLVSMFEQHWAEAHDPMKDVMPEFTLTPREQAVIALLSSGQTDAGVARELRISERSVSTIVRSIMDRLGVDNRFQLGVALGTLRAAPPPPGMSSL